MVQDFKKLGVWKKAIEFSVEIYKITREFPESEVYGLTSQLRRASVSVSSNISEGCGRSTPREFLKYLHISYGSIKEVENQLIIAQKLEYVKSKVFSGLSVQCNEISMMIYGLIKSVSRTVK